MEQLTLYGIGIKQKYGKYFNTLKARLYFLHFDIEDERELTQKKCNEVLDKYITIIKEIESKKSAYKLGNKNVFETKESNLCKYCDYQDICPLFTYINTDDEVIKELSSKTIKNLVDEFIEIKNKISELSKQETFLKNIFLQYIQKKDPNGERSKYLLQGTIEDIKISTEPKYNVLNKEKFITKMKELGLFEKYADISWQKVNELFKKSGKINNEEFENIVSKDILYKITKIKKKNS